MNKEKLISWLKDRHELESKRADSAEYESGKFKHLGKMGLADELLELVESGEFDGEVKG